MFIADYHTHCNFSTDSDAKMDIMVEKAIDLGLKELALTDHVDFDYPDLNYPFLLDYDEYYKYFFNIKEKYKSKIKLIAGIEVGLQPHLKQTLIDFFKAKEFDFIIASTHVVDRLDLCNGDFFKGKTKKEAYYRYFEDVYDNIKIHNNFNVYGHLDYISRYGNYKDKTLEYKDYKEIIDMILKLLIEKGKGIEINTSGYRYKLDVIHPQLDIIKSYKNLGGEIITIGSDAHSPEYITSHFEDAYKALKESGFKYITLFENQKPTFISI